MLGIVLPGPFAVLLYALFWCLVTVFISIFWYNKLAYHDEEDDREWDEETAFKMSYEPGYDPDDVSYPRR